MLTSLRKRQSGFTIVELLIVIIIIGILATLVVVQFTNQQKKARDTQRKTDVGAIETHLETYYAAEGLYPTFAELSDSTFRSDNLKGLKSDALTGPKGGTLVGTTTTNVDRYSYVGSDCTADGCENYTLSALLEDGNTLYTKASEN